MDDRQTLLRQWEDAWAPTQGWTPFSRILDGLTPGQAVWTPAPGRHSIWQIVNHLSFWGAYVPARARGGASLAQEEIDRRNWEAPRETTEAAWRAAVERYQGVRRLVGDALADPACRLDDLREMLPHHAYHAGQIMQLRALQGLAPFV